jgi:hypothetical protein
MGCAETAAQHSAVQAGRGPPRERRDGGTKSESERHWLIHSGEFPDTLLRAVAAEGAAAMRLKPPNTKWMKLQFGSMAAPQSLPDV